MVKVKAFYGIYIFLDSWDISTETSELFAIMHYQECAYYVTSGHITF